MNTQTLLDLVQEIGPGKSLNVSQWRQKHICVHPVEDTEDGKSKIPKSNFYIFKKEEFIEFVNLYFLQHETPEYMLYPERRVFYVDVGKMSPQDAKVCIDRIIEQTKNSGGNN